MNDSSVPTPPNSVPPTPAPEAPPTAQLAAKSPRNGLGITALVLGLVALAGVAIPVLNNFSAFLAAVGLVIGIVAVIRRAGSRGLSLSGTIVSGIALLLSLIFIAIYAAGFNAVVEEVTGDGVIVEEPSTSGEEPATEPAAAEVGTRDNPAPLGSTISFGALGDTTYELTFGPATLNANEAIAAANQFNDPPAEGFQFALLPVTMTYLGTETGVPWADLTIQFVSAAGTTHTTSDSFAVGPDPSLFDVNEMYNGATATGNVVIMIPIEGAASGTWTVSSLFGDKYFFTAE
jgi:hypothetical protein